MGEWQVAQVLKRDALGSVERLELGERKLLRRIANGGRLPLSGLVARSLSKREARALRALEGVDGVPRVVEDEAARVLPSSDGRVPRSAVLLRTWIEGVPLHLAASLPEDFFDRLDDLVRSLHEGGVCHNDLHKEQNIVVGESGLPSLIDFQLATTHARRGRLYRSQVRDDMRHVQKHRRRYTRDGRGPAGQDRSRGAGHGIPRSRGAHLWRRVGKPIYNWVTRGILRTRDGEPRRPESGPWPSWTPAVGPRPVRDARSSREGGSHQD